MGFDRTETKGYFLPGVVFAKVCEFLLVSLGKGFGVRFRWVVGVVFLCVMRKKGGGVRRVGGGVGTSKGTGKSMRKLCRNYLIANYLQWRYDAPLLSQTLQNRCAPVKLKHRQFTDLDVTDLGFSGPRIPFCATGALWGCVTPLSRSLFLGPAFGRTDFSRILIFEPPDFCGKKCPEKSSRKIPGKILQNLYNKNPPTHFCRLPRTTFLNI